MRLPTRSQTICRTGNSCSSSSRAARCRRRRRNSILTKKHGSASSTGSRQSAKKKAKRNAGDPGRVTARRLSNAEYDDTIRDLTGVDIRPTREFPVDPANEAGFDNSAESLSMSPALVKKYLEAAQFVADHLVLKPRGFDFAPFPVIADTDRDKYCVRQNHRFLQAAANRPRRLFLRRLAVPAPRRHSAIPGIDPGRVRRRGRDQSAGTWRRSGRS